METKEIHKPIVTWKLILILALVAVVASSGVYLYLRHTTSVFEKEIQYAIDNPDSVQLSGETDEEIEKKIEEMKKYLLTKIPTE